MSQNSINVREELQRFLNAVHALCPSRNHVSQYLLLMPKDYPTMYDMFPEFLSDVDTRNDLAAALGLTYGSQTNITSEGIGYHIRDMLSRVFDFMERSNVRSAFCNLLGISDDALINPRLEWIKARIDAVKSDERDGPIMLKILKVLALTEEPYANWRSPDDLMKKVGVSGEEFNRALRLCEGLYLVQTETHNKSGYVLSLELRSYLDIVKEILGI